MSVHLSNVQYHLHHIREIYLKPFEIVVKESDPWCLMTSYPKINGSYVDASDK